MHHRRFQILIAALCGFLASCPAFAAPPAAGPPPHRFLTLPSGVSLFEANAGLWRTDGTPTGTFRLTDDACGEACGPVDLLFPWIQAGGRAFIFSTEEPNRNTLWVTDETGTGLVKVFEGPPVWSLSQPVWVKRLGLLFFALNDPFVLSQDFELWCSDGTPGGTRKVRTISAPVIHAGVKELTSFKGRLFFVARDAAHGPSLWSSDGTEAGTVLVRELPSDLFGGGPAHLRVVGSRLLFVAPGEPSGSVLWASDGTSAGTRPLAALPPVRDARAVAGRLFVSTSQQLWTSDGTPAGTRLLASFADQPRLDALSFLKGRTYFEARTDAFGGEVWSTDGTPGGTRMLADLCPRQCSGVPFPGSLRVVGDRLLFVAFRDSRGAKLWQSDGTAAGTRIIQGASSGYSMASTQPVHRAAGQVFFVATSSAPSVPQLWRTDGTKAGTVPLTRFDAPGIADELIGETPGALFFRVIQEETGLDELWRTDGTAAGTELLKSIRDGV